MEYLKVKRVIDLVLSVLAAVILSPVFLILFIAIKLDTPGPIFFKQKRSGENGNEFWCYKFRSMRVNIDSDELQATANDPRKTKIGDFIRKASIDELPQFWNILKSDMSLVGTRPPTLDEYSQYTASYKRRLSFRPGLTGIWQSSGRNEIVDFQEVLKMDLEYIQNWSLGLDIKIIFKTLSVVLLRKGAV